MTLKKVKLKLLKVDTDLKNIEGLFIENHYEEGNDIGFLNISLEGNNLSASFVERQKSCEEVVDPFGLVSVREVINYQVIKINITEVIANTFLLVIHSPLKSIKTLTQLLSNAFSFRLSLGTVNIDISEFIGTLDKKCDVTLLRVNKAKANSIVVNNDSSATVEIISKKNAIGGIEKLLDGRRYSLNLVKASVMINAQKIQFELVSTGTVSVSDKCFALFIQVAIEHIISTNQCY